MGKKWIGSFNNNGSPILKISLHGISADVSKEFEAIVDTGFTGFLSMPMVEAFPLGLILTGTSKTILADGSSAYDLTALGTVTVEGESSIGTVLLCSGPGAILVGMEFLATFQKTLMMFKVLGERALVMMDDAEFEEIIKSGMERAAEQRKTETVEEPPKADTAPLS